jgi:catechol 2,3-dioxygenase-like lactoylglutathione lyase family enzyme
MTVRALDHVNIRTADVPGTAAFFRDVLLLELRVAPGSPSIDRGCWAYDAGGRPIFHIGPADAVYPSDDLAPFTPARGGGSVHHVALECDDPDAIKARLGAAGLSFAESRIESIGLTQLFVQEANGVLLELNFRT